MDKILTHNTTGNIYSDGNVSIGNQTTNYYKSVEWQDLEKEKQSILDNIGKTKRKIEKYPDDSDFKDELSKYYQSLIECNQKLEQFKHEILQLAKKFSQIKIDSKRRQIAYQAFLDGKYSEARTILETEESIQEHYDLLKQREYLKQQQEENEKNLQRKAEESILLAHLYMIAYSLGSERTSKAEKYFELAIKEHDMPNYRLDYALFLSSVNNNFQKAEEIYIDTLKQCEELILQDEERNLRYLIRSLSDFADLLQNYPNRWGEAENYYRRAITAYEKVKNYTKEDAYEFTLILKNLADLLDYCGRYSESEDFYNRCLAATAKEEFIDNAILRAVVFHDLSIMLAKNPKRFIESESFHKQALEIRRKLLRERPEILGHLLRSLKSLGKLLSDYPDRYDEAKQYYQEALACLKELIKKEGGSGYRYLEAEIYSNFAMLMNNVWEKRRIKEDAQQAQEYYEKAIDSYRGLNVLNPGAKKRELGLVLNNYGTLQFKLCRRNEAKNLYVESLEILEEIFRGLSEENSNDIQDDIAMVKTNLANLYRDMFENFKALVLYQQVLDIRIDLVSKQPDIYSKNLIYCIHCIEQSGLKHENLQIKYDKAINLLRYINT